MQYGIWSKLSSISNSSKQIIKVFNLCSFSSLIFLAVFEIAMLASLFLTRESKSECSTVRETIRNLRFTMYDCNRYVHKSENKYLCYTYDGGFFEVVDGNRRGYVTVSWISRVHSVVCVGRDHESELENRRHVYINLHPHSGGYRRLVSSLRAFKYYRCQPHESPSPTPTFSRQLLLSFADCGGYHTHKSTAGRV